MAQGDGQGAERRAAFRALFPVLIVGLILAAATTGLARAGDAFVVNAMEYPWSAIGRINTDGRGFCTGFLVGRRTVLTAAHCLYDYRDGRWLHPNDVHFVPGYQRDRQLGHSRAVSYEVGWDFAPAQQASIDGVLKDWAVVTLAKPLGEQVGWLGMKPLDHEILDRLKRGDALAVQAGYQAVRPHAIEVKLDCKIPGIFAEQQGILHSCEIMEGASGSPLLLVMDGQVRALGIQNLKTSLVHGTGGYGGALATNLFDPKAGAPDAISAGLQAGLAWDSGSAPIMKNGRGLAVPKHTVAQLLAELGYLAPPGERLVSPAERIAAIAAFERRSGLPVTGMVSIPLMAHLLKAVR